MKNYYFCLLLWFAVTGCARKPGSGGANTLVVGGEGVYSVRSKDGLTVVNIVSDGKTINLKIPADDPVGDVLVVKSANSRTIESVTVTKLKGNTLNTIKIDGAGVVNEASKTLP